MYALKFFQITLHFCFIIFYYWYSHRDIGVLQLLWSLMTVNTFPQARAVPSSVWGLAVSTLSIGAPSLYASCDMQPGNTTMYWVSSLSPWRKQYITLSLHTWRIRTEMIFSTRPFLRIVFLTINHVLVPPERGNAWHRHEGLGEAGNLVHT